MKSDKLFDLLGEIDDKFYEEARIPDEQYGIEIVSEHRPFGSFMSIFAPIAACAALIAVVIVGTNFIGRNAGLVNANESDSGSSFDVTLSSDSGVSSESSATSAASIPSEPTDSITYLEEYPPIDLDTVPDLKGSGLETQMTQQDKKLQKATLAALKCDDYELHLLGEYIHIDKSDDPNKLYVYNLKLAVVKNGEMISSDGTHTTSVSMGQGGYILDADDLDNYIDRQTDNFGDLILFKYHKYDESESKDYECTFFYVDDDRKLVLLMGDLSRIGGAKMDVCVDLSDGYEMRSGRNILSDGDVYYKFNTDNTDYFKGDPYEYPHFTAIPLNVDLSEYPELDMSAVPDSSSVDSWDQCLPKAAIAEKQVSGYTFTLIGEYLRVGRGSPKVGGTILAENVRTVISKDGTVIPAECEIKSYSIDIDAVDEPMTTAYEMRDGIVFELPMINKDDERFATIEDGKVVEFTFDNYQITHKEPPVTYDMYNYDVVKLLAENALVYHNAVRYTFDFDNTVVRLSYTMPVDTDDNGSDIDLSEYPLIDESELPNVGENPDDTTNAIPQATIAEKQVGEYTLSIIGRNLRTSSVRPNEIIAEGIRSVISRDGKIIRVTGENGTGVRTFMLTMNEFEDLFPDAYEMKDGIVFGLDKKSVQLSGTPSFGTIKYDVMLEFTAPALGVDQRDPFDGTVSEANGAVTVLPEENALIFNGTKKYVFDFDKVAYSETIINETVVEPEEFNFDDYTLFDSEPSSTDTIQPHVILDSKQAGGYTFYLLGDDVKVLSAKEFTNVHYTKLIVAAERNGEIAAFADMDNIHMFLLDNVSKFLQPFEMSDGIGFIMYYDYELPGDYEAMIYKLENDKITKLRYEHDYAPAPATGSPHYVGSDFRIDYDNNAIIVGDNKLTLDFDQNVFSETAREI